MNVVITEDNKVQVYLEIACVEGKISLQKNANPEELQEIFMELLGFFEKADELKKMLFQKVSFKKTLEKTIKYPRRSTASALKKRQAFMRVLEDVLIGHKGMTYASHVMPILFYTIDITSGRSKEKQIQLFLEIKS